MNITVMRIKKKQKKTPINNQILLAKVFVFLLNIKFFLFVSVPKPASVSLLFWIRIKAVAASVSDRPLHFTF